MGVDASAQHLSTEELLARIQAIQHELACRGAAAFAGCVPVRHDQEDLALLLDHSLNEIYIFSEHTFEWLYVNRPALVNLGYSRDEFLAMPPLTHMPDLTRDGLDALIAPLRTGTVESIAITTRHRRKDGSRYPADMRLRRATFHGRAAFIAMALDISERSRTEQALRESNRTLQMLIAAAPLPIVTVDADARVTGWNPAATALFGWTAEEVLGRELPYVPPGEEADADALFQQGLTGSLASPIHIRRCRKDGTLLELKLWPTFIRDGDGRLLLAFGLYEDVTEHTQAEAALKASEQRYQSLYHDNPSMYFTLSADGRVLSVNQHGAEELGYAEAELLGKSVLGVFDPADHATVLRQLALCARAPGRTFSWEIGKVRKDGSRLWVKERARCVMDYHGRETILIVCEDITDRKQAEDALRSSEIRLQRFVAEAPIGLVILDNQRRLLTANKAFCELTGYAEQDLIGHTYDLYTHPDDLPRNLTLTEAFYRGEQRQYTIEKRYLRKSGDIIWVSVKAAQIELPNHPGPMLLAVVQDITERRRAAEERERFSQDLHDNILQSLYAVGMQLEASKLSFGKAPRKSKAYTTQAIDHLNRLVGDVRQFIALLRQERSPALDFGQALRQLTASFSPAGETAPELDVKDDVIAMLTPEQGEQLLNIAREALSNSMRHAQAAHRWIRLSRIDGAIRMQICDDGIGFDVKKKRKPGHGLANMAARAKRIHARFSLNSTPGRGACITIDLPVEDS